MENTLSHINNIIIQTATSQGIGNGIYLSDYKLIVTNLSLIYNSNEIIISSKNIPKSLVKVVYTDSVFDLAFIKAPLSISLPNIKFANTNLLREKDELRLITNTYDLANKIEKVIITDSKANMEGLELLQYSSDTNSNNTGGLLINQNNELVGLSHFSVSKETKEHYALAVHHIKQILDEYKTLRLEPALRCPHCKKIISKKGIEKQICPKCNTRIEKSIIYGTKYHLSTTAAKIEEIIRKLNYEVAISRAGLNTWEIEEGSTEIQIRHDIVHHSIIADAKLCIIPDENKYSIYEYLLKENNYLKGLSFKLKENLVILSLMHIHENDFHVHSAARQFKELFNRADDYDDILIEMGAIPINDED